MDNKYIDRDISWLSFNARILQEIGNRSVPLMERLKFIAIYSSNLEEFYKVRVASHQFEQKYKGDKRNKYGYRPSYILHQIYLLVSKQQEQLGNYFYNDIIPEMTKEGIYFLYKDLSESDKEVVALFYKEELDGNFVLKEITNDSRVDLKNQAVYLFFIWQEREFLLEMNYEKWGRFIVIKSSKEEIRIIQLDDIFKSNITKFLGVEAEVYAVKISRDAELYIDEEQDEDIVRKIKKSLIKRETGLPCRLLFNENIPFSYINSLRKKIDMDMASLVPGGKYHNFYDFFDFPVFKDKPHLYYPDYQKVNCVRFEKADSVFDEIKKKDVFLSYPYQDFKYVANVLKLAAEDKDVTEINTTLYRVNTTSEICLALEQAARKGKKVFVLSEVLARFDEESNIYWGERLEKAGVRVKYCIKGLKVHAKIFTIKRKEKQKLVTYAYLGTGNLNEKTAGIYADHGILTASRLYVEDLEELFRFLKDESYHPTFNSLLVAPFVLRKKVESLINNEIRHAKKGLYAEMFIKLNSLEDPRKIDLIRRAADAGVKINMVVRGICCYVPLSKLQQENIKIVSVVDRFLEHTRIYHFYNLGKSKTYLASADWMTRNLSARIEVAFPVEDQKMQKVLIQEIKNQLNDSLKGRLVDQESKNEFVSGCEDLTSQQKMFDLIRNYESGM